MANDSLHTQSPYPPQVYPASVPLFVRPIIATEREAWDALMNQHHYLGFRVIVGESLRYMAFLGDRPVALIGWGAAAFKSRHRDAWLAFLSQIIPYADPDLEMLYSFARFLLPHLPLDRDTGIIRLGDEVGLQYYRLERIYNGGISLEAGEPYGVKSPTDVGTGKAKDEKAPLSEIIEILNARFGTDFTDEDRLFFEQIKEKAANHEHVIQTALANPFDKFQLGIKKLIEDLMIQRMTDNDKIVTRYMEDQEFQNAAFPVLAKSIFESILKKDKEAPSGASGAIK